MGFMCQSLSLSLSLSLYGFCVNLSLLWWTPSYLYPKSQDELRIVLSKTNPRPGLPNLTSIEGAKIFPKRKDKLGLG